MPKGARRRRTARHHAPLPSFRRLSLPLPLACALALACAVVAPVRAQDPAPSGDGSVANSWRSHGQSLLEAEDPVAAWMAFRRARDAGALATDCEIGLGRAHLMLGNSAFAVAYAEAALRGAPVSQAAMALCVRALIRAREFDAAVRRSGVFVDRSEALSGELLAARGSALFRVQRIDEAATAYQRVVDVDPLHPEAHLRLGSGLLPPAEVVVPPALARAVTVLLRGERAAAIELLQGVLHAEPNHPIAHRLLGEAVFAQRTAASMALSDPAFAELSASLPKPRVAHLPIAEFVPGYARLSPARRAVVDRTAAMFGSQLGKLISLGGRHDLLTELERTTDAAERASLRGRRTFDGRVWDDVRGVGGAHAATGIEALDDAATFGFDTLVHEVAHQVHYLSLPRLQRVRITDLYKRALAAGRCLDFYAASNEAEYFGQGVEAFASLCKRPGGEATHGHTRFELFAVDRELHDFIAGLVDFDPLTVPAARERVLAAAVGAALRCGRPGDAVVAAAMLPPGELRQRLSAAAAAAVVEARCH